MTNVSTMMTIGNMEIPVIECMLNHRDLKFYPENPRIYTEVNGGTETDQQELQESMCSMEHVKTLKLNIEAYGGLVNPILVRDGDLIVIDGNSRLAAYRLLDKGLDPKWNKIKCKLLPADTSDGMIFELLGALHIIGVKSWSPFEQAGYLYRRLVTTGDSVDKMAGELGLVLSDAKTNIKVYEFMHEHNDVEPQRWSHYLEYLKSRSIGKFRIKEPELDKVVVDSIKVGRIKNAIDIRDVLGELCKTKDKTVDKVIKRVISKEITIYEGFEIVSETGKTETDYKFLNKFRVRITDEDFQKQIKENYTSEIKFEIDKIEKAIIRLNKILNKSV